MDLLPHRQAAQMDRERVETNSAPQKLSMGHKSRGRIAYTQFMSSHKPLLELGKRIRSLREAAGLTQEDAAMEADLDRAYYGRIERGLVNVSALNLLKIAKALKAAVGAFFPKRQAGEETKL